MMACSDNILPMDIQCTDLVLPNNYYSVNKDRRIPRKLKKKLLSNAIKLTASNLNIPIKNIGTYYSKAYLGVKKVATYNKESSEVHFIFNLNRR